ncbi:hypothetical protein AALO_G00232020 [Alosa alosa]|uniref:Uncharacterized protein n=1 Tax=Alosa alosa TaxID=278164 RepID=A0AAV6FUB4_9TELE|nr:hypothetical protein AALO_G00232020 [Alosa alosa]
MCKLFKLCLSLSFKTVCYEDCFPENAECILEYSKLAIAAAFNAVVLTNKLISRINIDGDGGKCAFRRCHPAVSACFCKSDGG